MIAESMDDSAGIVRISETAGLRRAGPRVKAGSRGPEVNGSLLIGIQGQLKYLIGSTRVHCPRVFAGESHASRSYRACHLLVPAFFAERPTRKTRL